MNIEHIFYDRAVTPSWKVERSPTRQHIVFFILRGMVTYTVDGDTVIVRKGEGLYIRQGTLREATTNPDSLHLMISVHFSNSTDEDLPHLSGHPYRLLRPDGFDYLRQRIMQLHDCWIGQLPCYDIIARGIFIEILGIVQRDLTGVEIPLTKRTLAHRMQQHIVAHYREPLRMSELADLFERTPNYLSSVFKEATGRSPVAYLHEVRITAARELLQTTNLTIGEISDSLGYCDQTYFNHVYKKLTGHPPSLTSRQR